MAVIDAGDQVVGVIKDRFSQISPRGEAGLKLPP
jgi:hypothetical protein